MNNHVDVIMWLMKNRSEGGTESALQWAVSRGYTKVGDVGAAANTTIACQQNSGAFRAAIPAQRQQWFGIGEGKYSLP